MSENHCGSCTLCCKLLEIPALEKIAKKLRELLGSAATKPTGGSWFAWQQSTAGLIYLVFMAFLVELIIPVAVSPHVAAVPRSA